MNEKHMLSCKEAIEQMWAYIDGELAEIDATGVQKHLAACRGCIPHHDYQKAFCEFLRSHANRPVPTALRRHVFLTLLEEDRRAVKAPEPPAQETP
jgi:anti-sigma factor (TIGR02949 family)